MNNPVPHHVRTTSALATLALALALTGCGGDDHDRADVTFATEMVQHHAQALDMVEMTEGRPLDPAVQRLADQISAAQAPEITTMSGWLEDWDEEVPDTGSMQGMDTMPGMMSADEVTGLETASDADFQQRWLELMVEHHTGAVEMARTEQADGDFAPAIDLAGEIISSQTVELDTMRGLLGS